MVKKIALSVLLALAAAMPVAHAADASGNKALVMQGNSPEMVIIDIFRVENGKIAEHWDVMQPVPADAINKRPMY